MQEPDEERNPDEEEEAALHQAMIEELIERQPAIAVIRRFASGASQAPWFARLGDVLSKDDRDAAQTYLDGLGFGHAEAARVSSWEDAAAAASSLDWDSDGWAAEEGLRADLTYQALETVTEEEFEVIQNFTVSTVTPHIKAAAEEVAQWSDLEDKHIVDAAVGAAVQATHTAMLVLLAGEEGHPFSARYRLFTLGRWPMGVAGMTLNIF